jgi:phosphoribosylamine-glycine ligase
MNRWSWQGQDIHIPLEDLARGYKLASNLSRKLKVHALKENSKQALDAASAIILCIHPRNITFRREIKLIVCF